MRLGLLTAGGDCPGLNALIRAVVKRGTQELGLGFVGVLHGYGGLIEGQTAELTLESVRGILPRGGTILGASNRANPFQYPVREGGKLVERDVSDRVLRTVAALGLDGLIVVGGDGTMWVAERLRQRGVKVIGCPKTIDNDLKGTDVTFGFDTARGICTDAVDKLHTTAEAHQRVMVLEVMGRTAGFLALESGIAGGADVILIPELPYRIEPVLAALERRHQRGRTFSVIVVSEGARAEGEEQAVAARATEIPGRGVVRLGGAGEALAHALAARLPLEVRVTVLGHLQRGGSPSAADRLLATRLGSHALDLVMEERWGTLAAIRNGALGSVPLEETGTRHIDTGGEWVRLARSLDISLGV